MDIPHHMSKIAYSKLYANDADYENFKKKNELQGQDIDYSRFEVSFGIAFNLIIYTILMIYSLVNPIITIVGALYFSIKYFFDKYNLTLVYPKNYESKGDLGAKIVYYNLIVIYFV